MLISPEICRKFSDLEIIQKSLENIDYFSCLYQRYESRMLRYILRISAVSREEAEDILQEAFINIWKNLHAFNQGMKFSSWLYRVVHNQTISTWRRNKSSIQPQFELSDTRVSMLTQEDVSVNREESRLTEALQQLPTKYQEVLILKYYEEMSYEDISDILKIPEGTVATRLNRAKKALESIHK